MPDQIEALRANAARKCRSNLENSTGRRSSRCALPISEAHIDNSIHQSAGRSRTASAGRQGRSNGLNAETLTQLDHGTSVIRLDRPRGDARPPDPKRHSPTWTRASSSTTWLCRLGRIALVQIGRSHCRADEANVLQHGAYRVTPLV